MSSLIDSWPTAPPPTVHHWLWMFQCVFTTVRSNGKTKAIYPPQTKKKKNHGPKHMAMIKAIHSILYCVKQLLNTLQLTRWFALRYPDVKRAISQMLSKMSPSQPNPSHPSNLFCCENGVSSNNIPGRQWRWLPLIGDFWIIVILFKNR